MKNKNKLLTFDEWLEKNYPKNMQLKEYIYEFFYEGDIDTSLTEIEEFLKKIRKYFEEHNIQCEPKINIWSLPGRDEDEDSVPVLYVYYNRIETDEEYNKRLNENPNKYMNEYDSYVENYKKEQIKQTDDYKLYLKLKEKYKNI